MKRSRLSIFILMSFVFFSTKLSAFNGDSLKKAPLPKHYFNKTFYLDYYSTGKRELDTINTISQRLSSYQLSQFSMGYNFPVYTKDYYNTDSTRISNFHFLLSGNYTKLNLNFEGISRHHLSKFALGARGFYNNGKKSIFFFEIAPFVTKDIGYRYTRTKRLATTFLYNCSVNEYFSFRVGYTRSFLWGNRYTLPYLGVRFGKLDKINFSIQFPRGIALNVPVGQYIRASLYTKPQGGLYTFANNDSLQIGNINDNDKLYFGRYEFLSGLRLDVQPSKMFNFYLSSGFTTKNKIAFYPTNIVNNSVSSYKNYYSEDIKGSIFVNIGMVIRFGKTRSVYNNMLMYDAMDINNGADPSDNRGNGDIPQPGKKIERIDPDEVLDLIETQDLY